MNWVLYEVNVVCRIVKKVVLAKLTVYKSLNKYIMY